MCRRKIPKSSLVKLPIAIEIFSNTQLTPLTAATHNQNSSRVPKSGAVFYSFQTVLMQAPIPVIENSIGSPIGEAASHLRYSKRLEDPVHTPYCKSLINYIRYNYT